MSVSNFTGVYHVAEWSYFTGKNKYTISSEESPKLVRSIVDVMIYRRIWLWTNVLAHITPEGIFDGA